MYVYVNPMNFHHLPKLLASTLSVSSTRIAERRNARLFENGTPKLGDGPCERTNLTKKWVKISFPPTYDLQQFQCLWHTQYCTLISNHCSTTSWYVHMSQNGFHSRLDDGWGISAAWVRKDYLFNKGLPDLEEEEVGVRAVVKVIIKYNVEDTFLIPKKGMMGVTGTARLYPEWQSSLNQLGLCQVMGFSLVVWPVGKLIMAWITSSRRAVSQQQPATFNLIPLPPNFIQLHT